VQTFETFEVTNRNHFAQLIRGARLRGSFVSYGRLDRFGRSLTTTEYQVILPFWTPAPPMNIHRRPKCS
jgi:hypothetical protein